MATLGLFVLIRYLLVDTSFTHERPLNFDYRQQHATAVTTFLSDVDKEYNVNTSSILEVQRFQNGVAVNTEESEESNDNRGLDRRLLRPNQAYSVEVLLKLPRSPYNYEVGVFQLTGELQTSSGEALAYSTIPLSLPYQPPIVRLCRVMLRLPLLVRRMVVCLRCKARVDLFLYIFRFLDFPTKRFP